MPEPITTFIAVLLKAGFVMLVLNEIRGLVLVAPIMYGIYAAGGTWMAIWIGVCSLGGVAASVFVPMFAFKKVRKALA